MRFYVAYWSFFLILLMPGISSAQLSSDPPFPSVDQPVTIILNTQGTDLEGYDGDIYAHTGVILSEEDMDSGSWSNVVTDWGENTDETRLEQDESNPNIWRLEIEDIRDYYSVAESEIIYQLAFVFRDSDADTQTDDLFLDLVADEMVIRFDQPQVSRLNPFFAELGEEVDIEISASSPDADLTELRLLVDEVEVASATNEEQLSYSLEVENEGRTELRAEADDSDGNSVYQETFIIVNEPVVEEPRPDGIEDGITYYEDGSGATFSMYAPDEEFVYLIGDFNDWEVDPEYMMKRDVTGDFDGDHYWIEIDGLQPGQEYGFQYFVNGETRVADLYSEKVLDPWNDSFLIDDGIYPDLMEYPLDKTEQMVGVIHPGAEDYDWQAEDYQRPDPEELVVYELVIRDFLEEGTYSNMADTLDYFDRLGVNAIELMPVSQFDGNISWGYNPSFHFAVDKAYGPADELKRFIDEAHQRDIAVILDVVYNHATDQSPLIRLKGSNPDNNPMVGNGHAYNVFNHLNHDHPYIQYWLDRANQHWLEKFNVDGFRFDLTKGFANNPGISSNVDNYNEERVENLKRMGDEMWSVDSDSYIILEHFQRQEELELSTYGRDEGRQGMMFWNNMNNAYSEVTMGWGDDISATYYQNIDLEVPNAITYMESHDEQWLMHKNLNFGRSSSDGSYDVTELGTALDRQKAAGAFFLTVPGPRMLWQFGELGYGGMENECLKPGDGSDGDCEPDDPGRTDPKPVRWEYYEDEQRSQLFQTWQWLLTLRHEHSVFSDPDSEVDMRAGPQTKRIRLSNEDMAVSIVGNFGVSTNSIETRFHQSGTWYDYFNQESMEVDEDQIDGGDDAYSVTLRPGEFRIYTSEDTGLTPPENVGVPTSADDPDYPETELPERTELKSNYPNPFNPSTTVPFTLAESAEVTIEVFDVLGRSVATLVQGEDLQAGSHEVTFDASGMSSGTYIIRMQVGDQVFTNQMMFVK